jgi:predicted metal-binding protein
MVPPRNARSFQHSCQGYGRCIFCPDYEKEPEELSEELREKT